MTATGVINGWPTMGVASVILGGTAMAMALLLTASGEKQIKPKIGSGIAIA